jgi:hypothetical protein
MRRGRPGHRQLILDKGKDLNKFNQLNEVIGGLEDNGDEDD